MNKMMIIKLAIFLQALIFIVGIAPNCLAVEKQKKEKWVTEFESILDYQGDNIDEKRALLKEAVNKALDGEAPACEVMRIAIGSGYKPYFVMKSIYEHSQGVKLDELCWCATSDGVAQAIISKAVADAKKPNNDPVFRQNEIAKSECLKDFLAYTVEPNAADPITPPGPPPPNPRSPITP